MYYKKEKKEREEKKMTGKRCACCGGISVGYRPLNVGCRRPECGKLWRVQRGPAEGRRDVCRIVARKAHTVLEPKDRVVESVANGRVQQVALHIPKRFDLVAELAPAAQGSVSGAERT